MLKYFVDKFDANRSRIASLIQKGHPEDYKSLLSTLIEVLGEGEGINLPSPELIHQIDDGDYQGNFIFIIGAKGYQPRKYWYLKIQYGSCSGCDTLQNIKDFSSELPTESQVTDYMTLVLHMVQNLHEVADEYDYSES